MMRPTPHLQTGTGAGRRVAPDMSISQRLPGAIRENKTLWDGEDGETCPIFPVYRHPVFRRLKRICYGWMPGLFVFSLVVGRFDLAAWLVFVYLLFLLGVVALLVVATQHGKLTGAARAVQRVARGWRFLCPACLRFGPERFACGACGAEVEEFVLLTHGLYLNDCPACRARVFTGDQHSARARCAHCASTCEVGNQQRQVRVFGVLERASLQQLRDWPLVPRPTAEVACLWGDDGRQLTYVVDVGDPPGHDAPFGVSHAVRSLEALWLGEAWSDPLALAQALDRLIRRAQLTPAERAGLPVWVRDSAWGPTARNVLEARFPNVQYGVGVETVRARSSGLSGPTARTIPQPG